MIDGGPQPSELGIKIDQTPKAVLPPTPDKLHREETLTRQNVFSENVKDIILVPGRAELHNGNLANFLTQLNEQRGLNGDKLGIVLLLNDNGSDARKKPEVIEENRVTAQFLSLLTDKNLNGIDALDLPEEYKTLAKAIIENDQLEIRFDYAHSQSSRPLYGLLRSYLFSLASSFRNPSTPEKDITIHISDVDTVYSSHHFNDLKQFYTDDDHLANITEEDFLPGIHENATEEHDLTKDLLTTTDEFRLHRYYTETLSRLRGRLNSGSPMISGKFSFFFDNGQLKQQFAAALREEANEDFRLGKAIQEELGTSLGNVGEIYRVHRARTSDPMLIARSDAAEAYGTVKRIQALKERPDAFDFITNGDSDLRRLHAMVAGAPGCPQSFTEGDEYKQLLSSEITRETSKIRLRRIRLLDYVDSLSGQRTLTKTEAAILAPYLQYFQDETAYIEQLLKEGKSSQEIALYFDTTYQSFFDPNHEMHRQIATVRALKKYVSTHGLRNQELPNLDDTPQS